MHVLKWLSPVKNALKNILLGLVWLIEKWVLPFLGNLADSAGFTPAVLPMRWKL